MAHMSLVNFISMSVRKTVVFSKRVSVDTFSFTEYQFFKEHFVPQNSQ